MSARLQRFSSARSSGPALTFASPFNGGEQTFWVGVPEERCGIDVCVGDEAVDGHLRIYDRSEHFMLEALARKL